MSDIFISTLKRTFFDDAVEIIESRFVNFSLCDVFGLNDWIFSRINLTYLFVVNDGAEMGIKITFVYS